MTGYVFAAAATVLLAVMWVATRWLERRDASGADRDESEVQS
jgi:hypothetical protein